MIYMIDHYDSFTFNIVQALGEMGEEIVVRRNDEVTFEEIDRLSPDLLFLSPGAKRPEDTGMTMDVIEHYKETIPIFGVCLGHQTIAHVFGGTVGRTSRLMHGKTSLLYHEGTGIYEGMSQSSEVMNYHSLIVDKDTLPDCFIVTAKSELGEIAGIRHSTLPIEGVQFHPESIGSAEGRRLIKNVVQKFCKHKKTPLKQ
ncbi:anthranilate synthase component II [Salinicoccus hispanicus]|uniref:Aminodeoxychorismate/anthranilate synthase component II n=1 Tax=Salinicoccus hispanicus TaxID=157225 RepID=A0A6N8U0Y2_9STAP|nr:aminodeoxychorismate/anthranilate synthase component II [Salinicoccus hispanicus]MXQ50586.1 aminodeoxychorismate/anthranilate synthase component II [Salinicoccus hispanicus]